ncbi:hypothetical protein [Haloactinospora alba]|nr:hypothetical protein [Haloactinospora alba]
MGPGLVSAVLLVVFLRRWRQEKAPPRASDPVADSAHVQGQL